MYRGQFWDLLLLDSEVWRYVCDKWKFDVRHGGHLERQTVFIYNDFICYLDYILLLTVTPLKSSETNLPLCLLHKSQEPARLEWNMTELWWASQITLLGEPARLSCDRDYNSNAEPALDDGNMPDI